MIMQHVYYQWRTHTVRLTDFRDSCYQLQNLSQICPIDYFVEKSICWTAPCLRQDLPCSTHQAAMSGYFLIYIWLISNIIPEWEYSDFRGLSMIWTTVRDRVKLEVSFFLEQTVWKRQLIDVRIWSLSKRSGDATSKVELYHRERTDTQSSPSGSCPGVNYW